MSKRYWKLFAEDILEAIEKIESYLKEKTFEQFRASQITIDATIRNLEIIGEAAKYLPEEIRTTHQQVDWKGIVALRNRVIHEYFGVDLNIIWGILGDELPPLKEAVQAILQKK